MDCGLCRLARTRQCRAWHDDVSLASRTSAVRLVCDGRAESQYLAGSVSLAGHSINTPLPDTVHSGYDPGAPGGPERRQNAIPVLLGGCPPGDGFPCVGGQRKQQLFYQDRRARDPLLLRPANLRESNRRLSSETDRIRDAGSLSPVPVVGPTLRQV